MDDGKIQTIRERISQSHDGDEQQLNVIFSKSPRVIVEAPAGYGKTTTMVSRLAYLYASGGIPNPKKILGLTLSVNAALKIKREVAEKLPIVLEEMDNPNVVNERVTATNFHGFCKGVLHKYGYLVSPLLKRDINLMKAVGKADIEKNTRIQSILSDENRQFLILIEGKIASAELPTIEEMVKYNQIVISEMVPHDYITHDAVILLTIQLFEENPGVKQFYSDYYPLIVVDEFQDTNCMAWRLLNAIISEKTQLLFLGDPLQRIYGFIGAVPNIMQLAAMQFSMEKIALSENYRFRNNPEMLKLDAIIRRNAELNFHIDVADEAKLPAFWGKTQDEEAEAIFRKIDKILRDDSKARIAILFRGRNDNEAVYENILNDHGLDFFYGMFNDDDQNYIDFHIFCRDMFVSRFGSSKSISKRALSSFAEKIKRDYSSSDARATSSLFEILDALIQKVAIDYSDIPTEDKYELLLDIFENRQLKQAMEYVDSNIILSTVHGAKGLEWDYVFIADLERWIFPGFFICSACIERYSKLTACKCKLPDTKFTDEFAESILDELSVFYVAVTRARKQVYVSASGKKANNKDSAFSCFATLDGIKIVNAEAE